MDHTASFDRNRRGDSGQNNDQRKFEGYESDGHSVGSELVSMQSYRREFSRRQSLQLAPGGKDELRKNKKPFRTTWEHIRTDLHV